MKSNKPITKVLEFPILDEEGNQIGIDAKEILLDRLGLQLSINPNANIDAPITQSVLVSFKKCSADGWVFNDDEVVFQYPDVAKCKDMDILICMLEIDAALTKLVNKKGI